MSRYLAIVASLSLFSHGSFAVPVRYEFSAELDSVAFLTFDPVPVEVSDLLATLVGQSISGTFTYDSEVPLTVSVPGIGSFYENAWSDVSVSVAGHDLVVDVGTGFVHSDGDDRLLLVPSPFAMPSGDVLGYEFVGIGLAWFEGLPQDLFPPFLDGDVLPDPLPAGISPRITASLFVPGLTPLTPNSTGNAALGASRAEVRPVVAAPEPTTLSLLGLGLLAVVARRRFKVTSIVNAVGETRR